MKIDLLIRRDVLISRNWELGWAWAAAGRRVALCIMHYVALAPRDQHGRAAQRQKSASTRGNSQPGGRGPSPILPRLMMPVLAPVERTPLMPQKHVYHFLNGENNGPRLRYEIPRHHTAATKISGR